jgi:hypothetical protein
VSRGATFLLGAAASAWMIYDLSTATEAPGQMLALMKYFILGVALIVTAYSGAKWLTMK